MIDIFILFSSFREQPLHTGQVYDAVAEYTWMFTSFHISLCSLHFRIRLCWRAWHSGARRRAK